MILKISYIVLHNLNIRNLKQFGNKFNFILKKWPESYQACHLESSQLYKNAEIFIKLTHTSKTGYGLVRLLFEMRLNVNPKTGYLFSTSTGAIRDAFNDCAPIDNMLIKMSRRSTEGKIQNKEDASSILYGKFCSH